MLFITTVGLTLTGLDLIAGILQKTQSSGPILVHQYQRLDKLLAFDLFGRCVEKLCIFYGFKESPESHIGFIKYSP